MYNYRIEIRIKFSYILDFCMTYKYFIPKICSFISSFTEDVKYVK